MKMSFGLACAASVSFRFRRKERGTRVKDRAKNGPHFLALVSFLARPKPRIPFLGLSLLRNQTETLATQAAFGFGSGDFRPLLPQRDSLILNCVFVYR